MVESTDTSSFEYTLDTLLTLLFSAIAFIHQCNIVHCDINPASILIDSSMLSLLILDFGFSIHLNQSFRSRMHHSHSNGRSEEELNNIIMAV
jgi:serine/threonine protein kinase